MSKEKHYYYNSRNARLLLFCVIALAISFALLIMGPDKIVNNIQYQLYGYNSKSFKLQQDKLHQDVNLTLETALQSITSFVDFSNLSTIDWDTLLVFHPYGYFTNENHAHVKTIFDKSGLRTTDGHMLIIFMKEKNVIQFIDTRDFNDSKFDCLYFPESKYEIFPHSSGQIVPRSQSQIMISDHCKN